MLVTRHRRPAMQNEDRVAIFVEIFEEGNGYNGDLPSSIASFIRCYSCSCTLLRWSKRRCAEGPTLLEDAVRHFYRIARTFPPLDRSLRLEALRHRNGYAVAVSKAKAYFSRRTRRRSTTYDFAFGKRKRKGHN